MKVEFKRTPNQPWGQNWAWASCSSASQPQAPAPKLNVLQTSLAGFAARHLLLSLSLEWGQKVERRGSEGAGCFLGLLPLGLPISSSASSEANGLKPKTLQTSLVLAGSLHLLHLVWKGNLIQALAFSLGVSVSISSFFSLDPAKIGPCKEDDAA